jgi:hypothetical protein
MAVRTPISVARAIHKNPPFPGLFCIEEENSLDSALGGWRCSEAQPNLRRNSLRTGNLTGNFAYLVRERLNPMREAPELQLLLEQFPTRAIREYFIPNRELPIDIKEFSCREVSSVHDLFSRRFYRLIKRDGARERTL